MNYELKIREANIKPHMDIEKLLKSQKTGLFTFTLRINSGNIVDISFTEYVTPGKYTTASTLSFSQLTVTSDN